MLRLDQSQRRILRAGEGRTREMIGIYIMMAGMVLFVSIIGVMDLLARRQDRRRKQEP